MSALPGAQRAEQPDVADYDPFSHAVMADPFPFYAALRARAPVHYLERYDTWFLSRFEDIWQATASDAYTAERGVTPACVLLKQDPPPADAPTFTMLDRPRHRLYRKLLAPRYTRRAVAALEPRVRALARELLAPLVARGRFDAYRDYADPLATIVIGELLGLGREESLELRALVEGFFAREPGQLGTSAANEAARTRLFARFAEIVAARARRGESSARGDDHLSVWLRAEVEGGPLSLPSVIGHAFSMLVTGAEVVPLAFANTVHALWRHPEQRRAVIEDPALAAQAFAESLRYDQPTNLLGRFVKHDVEVGGRRLRAGQGVMLLWASGNRDEREFERADCFEITRRPRRTLSFGHGLHKCIGEHLGNLEGRVLLEELLAAAPGYAVDEAGAERAYGEFLHGYHRMPLQVD